MEQNQTVLEDGGPVVKKKSCSYRRPLAFLILFCMLGILYGFNMTDASSTWTNQLWTLYFNASSGSEQSNQDIDSSLGRFLPNLISRRTKTTTALPPPSNQPPIPSPEYKSPGPYLVEYPHKYNFIIDEPEKCRELQPFLVLMVPVAPHNRADRQIIRDTWGGQKVVSDKKVALFFLLGLGKVDEKELLEESKQNGDLLQSDFIDSYKNLTIKTMVMLEWLDSHCRDATYAMKIDSDMFLNVPKLIEMLQGPPKTDYLTGLVERAATVHRWQSKWHVPVEVFNEEIYPPYVLGLGYVLSLDLAKKLVEASREVKALYIEDVYVGMCMRRLGLQPSDPTIHGAFHVFPLGYNRCQYSRIIATTLDEHTDRIQLWRDYIRPGPYC